MDTTDRTHGVDAQIRSAWHELCVARRRRDVRRICQLREYIDACLDFRLTLTDA